MITVYINIEFKFKDNWHLMDKSAYKFILLYICDIPECIIDLIIKYSYWDKYIVKICTLGCMDAVRGSSGANHCTFCGECAKITALDAE